MKGKTTVLFSILTVAGFLALLIPVYFFISTNAIGTANRLKNKAKREYFAREYLSAYKTYQALIDSLGEVDDAASMNYANAAFMTSDILKKGFYGRSGGKGPSLSDTILQQIARESQDRYTVLTTSSSKQIASMAYNQLGYSTIKGNRSWDSDGDVDSVLLYAMDNFKLALRKNPNNDSARYNYELIRKVLGFPETILSQTRSLVAQRRYAEAAQLLQNSMERDVRLMKQKEYLDRIKAVAAIDSTFRRKQL